MSKFKGGERDKSYARGSYCRFGYTCALSCKSDRVCVRKIDGFIVEDRYVRVGFFMFYIWIWLYSSCSLSRGKIVSLEAHCKPTLPSSVYAFEHAQLNTSGREVTVSVSVCVLCMTF